MRGTAEPSEPPRSDPFHVPMADDFQNRVGYQRLRNTDLTRWSTSVYADQGIVFQNH